VSNLAKTQVLDPVFLFYLTASINTAFNSWALFASNRSLMSFTRVLENRPLSTPCYAQPPTPSATTRRLSEATHASSPPFAAFEGCGMLLAAYLKYLLLTAPSFSVYMIS
jgi:hypothetical protein